MIQFCETLSPPPNFQLGKHGKQPLEGEIEESFEQSCQSLRLGMWMRCQPESRASTDQAPGPIKAKAAPSVANSEWTTASPLPNARSDTPNTAVPAPAILVRYPVSIVRLAGVNKAQ
jgi:hypothetical protein